MNRTPNIYWGDIHNHCNISYGHGRLEDALARAGQQLDFCSVTGHAFWHDMPEGKSGLAEAVRQHTRGFEKLAKNWDKVTRKIAGFNKDNSFLAFQSYEWHSAGFGDYCIYYPGDYAPLVTADHPASLGKKINDTGGIMVPHHTAYKKGYRGLDWDSFDEKRSPLVEVFSMHGCSESDLSPYPYLHVMGPRDYKGTAEYGLERGYRFGFTASSDHHDAYPGSWGDGRTAIYADSLTRASAWKSMLARKTYAVTGDKIRVFFHLNGGLPGDRLDGAGKREINISLETEDFLDRVELVKNAKVIRFFTDNGKCTRAGRGKVKIRLEWGWGFKDTGTKWRGKAKIENGSIISAEPCFRGRPVLAPGRGQAPDKPLPHEIHSLDKTSCIWSSFTFRNPTNLHPSTQSVVLKLDTAKNSRLRIETNGIKEEIPISSLLRGSVSLYAGEHISNAVLVHRAVPESRYLFDIQMIDDGPEREIDYYYLRVSQKNGQWAWVTPVWIAS